MKRIVAVIAKHQSGAVVDALVAQGVRGVTLEDTARPVLLENTDENSGESVRLEVVIESHRADEVIESVEAIMDTVAGAPRLTVEDVERVVYIRSGDVLS